MKSLSRIAALGLFLATNSVALGEFKGVAAYAAMNPRFPCRNMLVSLEGLERPALQVLYGTFGTSFECVNRFVQVFHTVPHLLSFHLTNEVCRRNRRCFSGEMLGNLDKKKYNKLLEQNNAILLVRLKKRVEKIIKNTEISSHTTLLITTGLEDNYSMRGFKNVYAYLSSSFKVQYPQIQFARSPMLRIGNAGVISEFHGPRNCKQGGLVNNRIYNLDSSNLVGLGGLTPSKATLWMRSCRGSYARLLWSAPWQGYQVPFKQPKKRNFRFSRKEAKVVSKILKRG